MRWKWVFVGAGFLIIALMVTVYAVLASYDYNKLKPRLARMVKDATGRELTLGGDVSLTIGFTPALVVKDVAFANAPWGSQVQMIQVDQLQVAVRLLPLLLRDVALRYVGLVGVDVLLETDPSGKGNWEFDADRRSGKDVAARNALTIDIDHLIIEKLRLAYRQDKTGLTTHYTIDRLEVARQEAADKLAVDLRAGYNEHPVTFSGQTGVIRDVLAHKRFPLELTGTFSKANVEITGVIDDVLDLQGIALKAHISGTDLAALGLAKTILLPKTSVFDVKGRLEGSKESLALKDVNGDFSGNDLNLAFNGNVGDVITFSDIDLKVNGSGQDLAAIGSIIGHNLPATDTFDFLGRLQGSTEILSLGEAQASAKRGSLSIVLSGAVKDLVNFSGLDLQVKGSGQNLTEMASIVGAQLPVTDDFSVEGRLKGSAKTLSLNAAQGYAKQGHLNLTLNGEIKDVLTFSGVALKASGSGADLADVGKIIDIELPATDEFKVQGLLTGSGKSLSFQQAQGSAKRDSLRVVFSGAVKDLLNFSGLDLQVKGSGKNLADMASIVGLKLPATDDFAVEGRLQGSARTLSLNAAQGHAKQGSLNLTLNGQIKDVRTFSGVDLKMSGSGRELAEIGPLVGADMPELGPFDMSAKLAGSAKAISLNAFSAHVDKSDFKGRASVDFLKRPKITLRLESSVIDFTRLMKTWEKNEEQPDDKMPQQHRFFSDVPLPLDVFKKVDADILINARNIRAKDARLEFGHMTLKLEDGDFSIDRLEAAYKKTKISGTLNIDASSPPQVAVNFLVQSFDLGNFLKETGKSDTVQAVVDIAAHGKSRGNSVHRLMANLDGSIGAVMGKGYLTKYLNMLSVNLSQKVLSFWNWARRHRVKAEQINCAVVQFDIKEGVATSQAFVFNSQLAVLTGEGEINLGSERIDFLLMPNAKDPALLSLSTNLRVRGSLLDPQVRPDKRSLLTQGAWALSSLAIGPLGLLAPFVHLGAHKAHPCDVPSIGDIGHRTPPKSDGLSP